MMETDELQTKQHMLKSQKQMLWRMLVFPVTILAITVIFEFWLMINRLTYAFPFNSACSLVRWTVFFWYINKAAPLETSIKNLKEQIAEEKSAHWREEIAAKIRTGKIRPNPNLP